MPVRDIKTRLSIDGEAAYKKALADINREMRVLNSEMKATTSEFADNADSVEALSAKQKVLTKQIDQQKVIVASLAGAVEDATQKYGEGSKIADDYRIQMLNATATLNKMQAELKQNENALDTNRAALQQMAGELKGADQEIELARLAFKKASAGMDDWRKSEDGLNRKAEELNIVLEHQKRKMNELYGALMAVGNSGGLTAEQMHDLRRQMLLAETAVAQTEKELRDNSRALNELQGETKQAAAAVNKLGDEEQKTEKKTHDFSGAMEKVKGAASTMASGLMAAAKAIGIAAAAAGAAALGLGKEALEAAGDIQQMADVTGRTAEELQIMQYQGKNLGVELETLTGAQAKLTKTMANADAEWNKNIDAALKQEGVIAKLKAQIAEVSQKHGNHKKELASLNQKLAEATEKYRELENANGKNSEALDKLGIALYDENMQLRDSKIVMQEVIDALGKVSNETERDALAMQIFGKSAMELNPLIKAGGDELARLAEEAMKTGAVMSNDAVAGLDAFGDSIDSLKQSVTGIAGTMLNSLMPTLGPIIEGLKGLAVAAATASKTGDWSGFISGAVGMVEQIAAAATGMLPTFIKVGTQILTMLVRSLVESIPVILPQLAEAIVSLVQAITSVLATNGPMLITAAIEAIGTLIQGLLTALPMLMQAAIQIVLALVQGIAEQLPTLIPAAVDCILTLVQTLVDNLPMLIDAALALILALVDGVIAALPKIMQAAPKIITSLINGIVDALPKLLDAALEIVLALIDYFPEHQHLLIEAMPEIISAIVTGLIQAVGKIWEFVPKLWDELVKAVGSKDWGKIGKDLLNGLVEGLKKVGGNVWKALKDIVNSAVDSFKRFFGIASPSKYMRDQIGANLGSGIAEGIAGSAGLVGRAMNGLRGAIDLGAMSLSMAPTLAMAGGPSGGGYSGGGRPIGALNVNVTGPFYVRSDADIKLVAQEIHRQGVDKLRALGVK
jgi:phage-related protein/predicted  nucleic acid-binding Zn-ribbon protein